MVSSRIPSPLFSGQALSGKLSQETVTRLPCSRRILPVERQVLSVVTSRKLNMRLRVASMYTGYILKMRGGTNDLSDVAKFTDFANEVDGAFF